MICTTGRHCQDTQSAMFATQRQSLTFESHTFSRLSVCNFMSFVRCVHALCRFTGITPGFLPCCSLGRPLSATAAARTVSAVTVKLLNSNRRVEPIYYIFSTTEILRHIFKDLWSALAQCSHGHLNAHYVPRYSKWGLVKWRQTLISWMSRISHDYRGFMLHGRQLVSKEIWETGWLIRH